MIEALVVDASAAVDLLVGSELASDVERRLRGCEVHVPAHFDAEVLSALGRLQRSGLLTSRQAGVRLRRLADAPFIRHLLPSLVAGAWRRRHNLRLVDGLYVELAEQLQSRLLTTDRRLAAAYSAAEYVTHSE